MKIINLKENANMYTSNVYLVLGTWNAIEDVNTLVDVGRDPAIMDKIYEASTGVGKSRVEQVILTHSHYDHASFLPAIREAFHPKVYAFSHSLEGVDHHLRGWETLRLGDRNFEVIHTPGHSSDSICLYCEEEGVLFAGDTPVIIQSADSTHEEGFVRALERICRMDVKAIYFGHGDPLLDGCNERIRTSLKNVRKALGVRNQQSVIRKQ